jgi:outer membrane PBP1 activator LpoA protein
MKPLRFRVRPIWPVLFVLLLHACETVPPRPPEPPVSTAAAEQAERRGEYAAAAREYERLAGRVKPPQRQQLQLRAVEALIKGGQAAEARQKLAGVRVAGLDSALATRKRVLEARLLVLEGAHEKALRALDEVARGPALDPQLRADIALTRARAEVAVGNPFGAVRDLVRREQFLAAKEAVADNQFQIWKILSGQPRAKLATELDLARDPVVAGWIELALAVADAGGAERIAPAVEQWKKTHAGHPVGEPLLATLAAPAAAPAVAAARPRLLALLLPLNSNIALAAQAVRDGFLAMDGANANPEKPQVKVYDIGADPAGAPEVYAQALREGAQAVVGPLGRDAAERIARDAKTTVPTLLLSYTDENGRGRSLYQFGLPPEQEARAVAERAWHDGHRRAAVLYPKDTGERMLAAFTRHWQRLGGVVAAAQAYDEGQSDHSNAIKRLLNIHLSEARKAEIERRVGQKLQFEPRARRDIDFIFLAADAKRARLLKPQLNFWHASRVPVYATSLVYTGRPDPVHDVDLDGIVFADMPWILLGEGPVQELRQNLQREWPYAYSDLDRLYALGMDSYAVLPYLNRLGADAAGRFGGVTSTLTLDPEGRLQRQLLWARFVKGVPRLLDASPPEAGLFRLSAPGS